MVGGTQDNSIARMRRGSFEIDRPDRSDKGALAKWDFAAAGGFAVLALGYLLLRDELALGLLLATAAALSVGLGVLVLRGGDHMRAHIAVVSTWIGASAAGLITGGVQASTTVWLVVLPLLAALTEKRDVIRGSAAGSVISIIVLTAWSIFSGVDAVAASLHGLMLIFATLVAYGTTWRALNRQLRLKDESVVELERRSAARRDVRDAYTRLQVVMDHLPYGVAITDRKARIIALNGLLLEMFGIDEAPVSTLGKTSWRVISMGTNPPADLDAFKACASMVTKREGSTVPVEVEMKDGQIFEQRFVAIAFGEDRLGQLWSYHDVTDRVRESNEIRSELQTDALTHVGSQSFFVDRLTSLCRSEEPFTLVFLDLDGFKEVNDTHGHEVGDEVLVEIRSRLKGAVRSDDLVGRFGGDEFAVLLKGLDDKAIASRIASKLVGRLRAPMVCSGQDIEVGASLGIAIAPDDANGTRALLKLADDAMYAAKRSGSNQHVFSSDLADTITRDEA